MDSQKAMRRRLAVSVVSHGHVQCVVELLNDLRQVSAHSVHRVIVTLNLREEELPLPQDLRGAWPFEVQVRRNAQPLGFGANHNRALADAPEEFVCVLNPDVRLDADPFAALVHAAAQPGVGCAYPVQLDEAGNVQDSERSLPSPVALWQRRVMGRKDQRVDWVNAACVVLPTPVWRELHGFDERYFMYCEDVDLSLRIRLAGLKLVRVPVMVMHAAQRASRRSLHHLTWHVRSLLRLWRSPAYRNARALGPLDVPYGAKARNP